MASIDHNHASASRSVGVIMGDKRLKANFTRTECDGRHFYQLNGKQYGECSFCRASCPSRDFFIEPDSGLPLKCDMCEDEPPLAEPLCVTACQPGCLTYAERQLETEANEPGDREAMERGLQSLVNQHGIQAVIDNLKRLS